MQQIGHKHGGQLLLPDSVGQLRRLDRAACAVCGAIRSQRCNRCGLCNSNTPLRELRVGNTFQDRRQPGHQDAAASGTAAGQQPLRAHSQCTQRTHLTTARFQTAPFGTLPSQNGTSNYSPSFSEHPRWHSRGAWSLATLRLGHKASKKP